MKNLELGKCKNTPSTTLTTSQMKEHTSLYYEYAKLVKSRNTTPSTSRAFK
ncbi:hypothetical protein DPMN_194470 [Dreissena polymorpha]|uniref:Uncharacterized protein n=1 Tax=Dreissena polymorpha TaxID=45954 RepID=A0A9D3Y0E8_DREPO|nr:hypothetical protein DPMN_194470 [Dreissena polymorpha]